MATIPLSQWPGGVLATSYLNNPISYLNTTLPGFGNSGVFTCSADLTLTTSIQDLAGCTTTFTIAGASAFALVIGTFDADVSVSSASVLFQGKCVVDGNTQSAVALAKDNGANTRQTTSQFWLPSLDPGPHTIKLQGLKSGSAAGTHIFHATHTQMTVVVFDLP